VRNGAEDVLRELLIELVPDHPQEGIHRVSTELACQLRNSACQMPSSDHFSIDDEFHVFITIDSRLLYKLVIIADFGVQFSSVKN